MPVPRGTRETRLLWFCRLWGEWSREGEEGEWGCGFTSNTVFFFLRMEIPSVPPLYLLGKKKKGIKKGKVGASLGFTSELYRHRPTGFFRAGVSEQVSSSKKDNRGTVPLPPPRSRVTHSRGDATVSVLSQDGGRGTGCVCDPQGQS